MSTRAQVQVHNKTEDEVDKHDKKLTLYHHTDGYPKHMLPSIKRAWEEFGQGWKGARVYKVASMLCAIEPTIYEPLDYHELHADIEYYYEINCSGDSHVGAEPVWEVTAYRATFDFDQEKDKEERLHEITTVSIDEDMDRVLDEISEE